MSVAEMRRDTLRIFPPPIPTCMPLRHLLTCGHLVDTINPLCSRTCFRPRWGGKRDPPHTCPTCVAKSDISRLIKELDDIEFAREGLRQAENIYLPYSEQLEDLKDKISEREMALRTLVPVLLYRRYQREGRAVLEDELNQQRELEKALHKEAERKAFDNLLEYYQREVTVVTLMYTRGRVQLVKDPEIDVRHPWEQLRFEQFPRARGETEVMAECRYRSELALFLFVTYQSETDVRILWTLVRNKLSLAIQLPLALLEELQDIMTGYQPARYLGNAEWEQPRRQPLIRPSHQIRASSEPVVSTCSRSSFNEVSCGPEFVATSVGREPVAQMTSLTSPHDEYEENEDELKARAIQVYTEGLARLETQYSKVKVRGQLATGEYRFTRFPANQGESDDEREIRYREELTELLFIRYIPHNGWQREVLGILTENNIFRTPLLPLLLLEQLQDILGEYEEVVFDSWGRSMLITYIGQQMAGGREERLWVVAIADYFRWISECTGLRLQPVDESLGESLAEPVGRLLGESVEDDRIVS